MTGLFGIKRLLDLLLSIPAIILSSPLLVILAMLTYLKVGSPILFRQTRPGLHGKPFTLYKYRTMTNQCDSDGTLLPESERLTSFGKTIRSLSLDELPELWNVIKGDMSIVGPRPLLMEYLDQYTPEQRRRHEVKPGITGWAQVNGRNAISWEEKFARDIWYVDNHCLWLDMKILWMTVINVLKREGINQKGHSTMPFFTGSNDEDKG